MATYHQYSTLAGHTIYYRFTCAQCKKTTDWIPYKVEGQGAISVRGQYIIGNAQRDAQLAAQKQVQEKLRRMKIHVENGHYFKAPFSEAAEYSYYLNDVCPFCGAMQKSNTGGGLAIFMSGLMPALLWIIIVAFIGKDNIIPLALLAIPIFIIIVLLLTHRRNKKFKRQEETMPEYSWN